MPLIWIGLSDRRRRELKLLRQDVLEEMLESCYDEGTEAFLEFAEKFSTGRSDRQLEEVILQLYEYAGSYPQPEKWLNACVDNYQVENEHFSDAGFVQIPDRKYPSEPAGGKDSAE